MFLFVPREKKKKNPSDLIFENTLFEYLELLGFASYGFLFFHTTAILTRILITTHIHPLFRHNYGTISLLSTEITYQFHPLLRQDYGTISLLSTGITYHIHPLFRQDYGTISLLSTGITTHYVSPNAHMESLPHGLRATCSQAHKGYTLKPRTHEISLAH